MQVTDLTAFSRSLRLCSNFAPIFCLAEGKLISLLSVTSSVNDGTAILTRLTLIYCADKSSRMEKDFDILFGSYDLMGSKNDAAEITASSDSISVAILRSIKDAFSRTCSSIPRPFISIKHRIIALKPFD